MSVSFSDEADSTQSSANGTENNILQNEGRSYLFVQATNWCSLISHCPRSSNRASCPINCAFIRIGRENSEEQILEIVP